MKPQSIEAFQREFTEATLPYEDRIVECRFFREMAKGKLSLKRFRMGLFYFYPLVAAFPHYMGATLAKLPGKDKSDVSAAKDWLIQNISIERSHAEWYKNWAVSFGVDKTSLETGIDVPAEVDAINNFLWRTIATGTVTECLAAINYGVEGPTGKWTKAVRHGVSKYKNVRGVCMNSDSLTWLKAHARYDDQHPEEALTLIADLADTRKEQLDAIQAACRSMEYYAMAAEAIFDL